MLNKLFEEYKDMKDLDYLKAYALKLLPESIRLALVVFLAVISFQNELIQLKLNIETSVTRPLTTTLIFCKVFLYTLKE